MKSPEFNRRNLLSLMVIVFLMAQGIGIVLSETLPEHMMQNLVAQRSGLNPRQLKTDAGGYTGNVVGRTAYMRFRDNKNPARNITVRLTKEFHFIPWHVTEYVDETGK